MGPPLPYGFPATGLVDWRDASLSKVLSNFRIPDDDLILYPLNRNLQRTIQLGLEPREFKSDINELCRKGLIHDPLGSLLLLEMLWRYEPFHHSNRVPPPPILTGSSHRAVQSRSVQSRSVQSRSVQSRSVQSRSVQSRSVQSRSVSLTWDNSCSPEIKDSNDWLGAVLSILRNQRVPDETCIELLNEMGMTRPFSVGNTIIVAAVCLSGIEQTTKRSVGVTLVEWLMSNAQGDDYGLLFILLVYILASTNADVNIFEQTILSRILLAMLIEPTKSILFWFSLSLINWMFTGTSPYNACYDFRTFHPSIQFPIAVLSTYIKPLVDRKPEPGCDSRSDLTIQFRISEKSSPDSPLWAQLFCPDSGSKLSCLLTRFIQSPILFSRLSDLEAILLDPSSQGLINIWANLLRNLAASMYSPESLHNALLVKYYSHFSTVLADPVHDPVNTALWKSSELQNIYCSAFQDLFGPDSVHPAVLTESGGTALYYLYNCLNFVIRRNNDPSFLISRRMRLHLDRLLGIFLDTTSIDKIKPLQNICIRRSCPNKLKQTIWKRFFLRLPGFQRKRTEAYLLVKYTEFRKILKSASSPWDILFLLNFAGHKNIPFAVTLKYILKWTEISEIFLRLGNLMIEVCASSCTADYITSQITEFHQSCPSEPIYREFISTWLKLLPSNQQLSPYIFVCILDGFWAGYSAREPLSMFFCTLAYVRSYAPNPAFLQEMFTDALLLLRLPKNPIVFWIETFYKSKPDNKLLSICLPILLTPSLDSFDPEFIWPMRNRAREKALNYIVNNWIDALSNKNRLPVLLVILNFQPFIDIITHPLSTDLFQIVTTLIELSLNYIFPTCETRVCVCDPQLNSIILNYLDSAISLLCGSLQNRPLVMKRLLAKLLVPINRSPIPRGPDLDFRFKGYFMSQGLYSLICPNTAKSCTRVDIWRLILVGACVTLPWPEDSIKSEEIILFAAWVFSLHVRNIGLENRSASYPPNENGSTPIEEYWYKFLEHDRTNFHTNDICARILEILRQWIQSSAIMNLDNRKGQGVREYVQIIVRKTNIMDLYLHGRILSSRKSYVRTPLFWIYDPEASQLLKHWIRAPENGEIDWLSLPKFPVAEHLPMMLKLIGLQNDSKLMIPDLMLMALVTKDLAASSISQLRLYLPQIVQSIRGDHFRILESELFRLATSNLALTRAIYSEVSKEMGNTKLRHVFGRLSCLLETWVLSNINCRDIQFILELMSISYRAITELDDRSAFVRGEIVEVCRRYEVPVISSIEEADRDFEGGFFDPFDEKFILIAVCDLSRCRVLKSASKAPFVVEFVALDTLTKEVGLRGIIFKMNDDLRSDQLASQFFTVFQQLETAGNLPLWIKPYGVQCCYLYNCFGGLIELVPNSRSRHEIGKNLGMSLNQFYYNCLKPNARWNFLRSLAAYSIVSFVLQIKDRHNANMLVTDEGYLLHIDFGFIMDLSPGGDIRFERAPFKLTQDMVDLVNGSAATAGITGCGFLLLKKLIVDGYMRLRRDAGFIRDLLLFYGDLCCFKRRTIKNLMRRLKSDGTDEQARLYMASQVDAAYNAFSTRIYDRVQAIQQGISYK